MSSVFVCRACAGQGQRPGRIIKRHRQLLAQRERWERRRAADAEQNLELGPCPPPVPAVLERVWAPCAFCQGVGLRPASTEHIAAVHTAAESCDGEPLVAIVGAGIGGSALALALQQRGMRTIVFERDVCFDARAQGYGLTMQQGGTALRGLGLQLDSTVSAISSTAHYSYSPDGTVLGCYGRRVRANGNTGAVSEESSGLPKRKKGRKTIGNGKSNCHIPRQELRRLLHEALLPGTVRWNYRLIGYHQGLHQHQKLSCSPEIVLRFENGQEFQCNVLVGADGIFSAVREQKLGQDRASLRYLGLVVVLGIAPCDYPGYGETVCQTLDGDTRMYTMPFTNSTNPCKSRENTACDDKHPQTMWQLSFSAALDEAKALSGRPERLLSEAKRRCGSWHAPIPDLLQATRVERVTGYPVYDRPPLEPHVCRHGSVKKSICRGTCDTHDLYESVTLLGDAAHPMSPFKGQGANQALLDALSLARHLYASEMGRSASLRNERSCTGEVDVKESAHNSHPGESSAATFDDVGHQAVQPSQYCPRRRVSQALASYEAEMLSRSEVKVRVSAENAQLLHDTVAMAVVDSGNPQNAYETAPEASTSTNTTVRTNPGAGLTRAAAARAALSANYDNMAATVTTGNTGNT